MVNTFISRWIAQVDKLKFLNYHMTSLQINFLVRYVKFEVIRLDWQRISGPKSS